MLAVGGHFLGNKEIKAALPYSSPFAGGVGGTREALCGALTGGLMVIGGMYGREDGPTPDQECQDLAAKYRAEFLREFGWLDCGDLRKNWVGKKGQETCKELVQKAAGLLAEILDANP